MSTPAILAQNAQSAAGLAREELVEILAGDDLRLLTVIGVPDQASSPARPRGVSNALLDAVREVALVAAEGDIDAARLVSKAKWNEARERAGHPELPMAEPLRQRLKLRHWQALLAVAFLPPQKRSAALGSYNKRVTALSQGATLPELRATPAEQELIRQFLAEEDFLDGVADGVAAAEPGAYEISRGVSLASGDVLEKIIIRALQSVSYRLGHSPTGLAYDETLNTMEDERERAGLPPLGFPLSGTIVTHMGSWAKAVTAAGLEPPPAHTRPKGLPTVDVLDEYVERNGIVPGFDCFRAWCAACELSVQHRRTDSWDVVVAEMREQRAARGATTPEAIVRRKRDWPPLPSPEEAAAVKAKLGGPRRYKRHRTEEEVRAGLRIYAAEYLKPGARPATRTYMSICGRDPRLVWPSKMKGITGKTFAELCAEEGI